MTTLRLTPFVTYPDVSVGVLVGVSVSGMGVSVGVLVSVGVFDSDVLVGVFVGVSEASVGVMVGVLVGVGAETAVKQAASNLKVLLPSFCASTRTLAALFGAIPCNVYCVTRGGV